MLKFETGPNYHKNTEKLKGTEQPCLLCGKPCPNPKYMVHLHCGGDTAVTEEEAEALNANGNEGSDLGMYPIGNDCLKKHPEFNPYIQKTE